MTPPRTAVAGFAAVVVATLACSSSVLVRHDDATFARAQRRLQRTVALVDDAHPPAEDRAWFLQGEAFYRYRFQPAPRGFLTYIAQGAAVAIELPMLQAVAGSLDLMDLRLKSYDGAIHLWESMLVHRPATPLRPLTLYRLGWAYRNAGAAGFPRDSGDQAFDLLAHDYPSSPLARLALDARQVPWKSKDTATALSLVPGLGQVYVREYANGAVRFAIGVASVAMVAAPAVIAYRRRSEVTLHDDWPLLVSALAGLIFLGVDYTTAYQDALRGVVNWNEQGEAAFEDRHPDAP